MRASTLFPVLVAGCVARAADTAGGPDVPPPPDAIPGVNDLIIGDWDCRTIGYAEGRLQGVAFHWTFTPDGLTSTDLGSRVANALNSGAMSRENAYNLRVTLFVDYVGPDGFGGGDYYVQAQDMVDYRWSGLGEDLVLSEWYGGVGYVASTLFNVHPLADGTGGFALIPKYTDCDFVCFPASG